MKRALKLNRETVRWLGTLSLVRGGQRTNGDTGALTDCTCWSDAPSLCPEKCGTSDYNHCGDTSGSCRV